MVCLIGQVWTRCSLPPETFLGVRHAFLPFRGEGTRDAGLRMSRDARLRMSAGKAKPGGEGGPLAVIHVHHIQGMIKKLFNTERKKK